MQHQGHCWLRWWWRWLWWIATTTCTIALFAIRTNAWVFPSAMSSYIASNNKAFSYDARARTGVILSLQSWTDEHGHDGPSVSVQLPPRSGNVNPRTQRGQPLHLFAFVNGDTGMETSKEEDTYGTLQSEYIPLDVIEGNIDLYRDPDTMMGLHKEDFINIVLPLIAPVLAYTTYDAVASAFSDFIDFLSTNRWVAVDGGAYQAKIITPAINGVVIPAIAVLFATLTSTTVSSLRERQVQIRQAINLEAGELRVLETMLSSFPAGPIRERCTIYLIQYTSRLISECCPTLGSGANVVNPRRGMDSELNGFLQILNNHYHEMPSHIADQVYGNISKLREQRQIRITALQSTYPSLHYMILAVSALAECVGFLIEANQDVLVFLNAVQLKLLWSMLVGTFVACFTVFVDLRSPFSGSYQISASVDQLHTIRLTLKASIGVTMQSAADRVKQRREATQRRQKRENPD